MDCVMATELSIMQVASMCTVVTGSMVLKQDRCVIVTGNRNWFDWFIHNRAR